MAELVDALDSKSSGSDIVSVQVRFGPPYLLKLPPKVAQNMIIM